MSREMAHKVIVPQKAGIQGEGTGWWQGSPSPSHYSVGIHGCLLVGGGVL